MTKHIASHLVFLLAAAIASAQNVNPYGRAKGASDQSAHEQAIRQQIGNYDVRKRPSDAAAKDASQRRAADRKAAVESYLASGAASELTGARTQLNASGLVKRISADPTPLSGPAQGPREEIARSFLQRHAKLFGIGGTQAGDLLFTGQSGSGPLTVVRFQQAVDGVPVLHGLARVTMTADGEVIEAGADNLLLDVPAPGQPNLTPLQAVQAAFAFAGNDVPAELVVLPSSTSNRTDFANPAGPRLNPIRAELMLFPLAVDEALLAYRLYLDLGANGTYQFVIDASDGRLLQRLNLVDSVGQARIFPKSPIAGERELRDLPDGAIPDDGTVTNGNNADAYLDADGDNSPDATTDPDLDDGRASSDTQVFDFPFGDGTTGEDPADFAPAAITNAFYFVNFAHNYFYGLGFDEPAGNYQVDNFGRGGIGGDPVFVEVQDAFFENNAAFTRAPDGAPGRLQLGLFTILTGLSDPRDAGYDAQVIIHEYGHGVTNRLAAGPANIDCLLGTQSDGMDEGWADYFSISITDDPVQGAYLSGNSERGIRRAGYENYPFTYADIGHDGFIPVHDEGEIWAATLWDARTALGAEVMDQLVYDGLAMTGCSPDMIESRDMILAADQARNGGANRAVLWEQFAAHGMGSSAGGRDGTPEEGTVIFNAAFDLPPDLHQGNRGPMITSTPPPDFASAGQQYVYDIEATDPEGDTLTFELTAAPEGMTIDPVTGRIEWIASFVDQRVVVIVRDGNGNMATHGFIVPIFTELQPAQAIEISVNAMEAGLAFINVPAGMPVFQVRLRGDNGDADLAVISRSGNFSLTIREGSNETLSFPNPEPGEWIIIVSAFSTFENTTLEADFPIPTRIARNGEVTGLAGVTSSETFFEVDVPAGADVFRATTTGGAGDVDLFAARGVVAVCQGFDTAPCSADAASINEGNDDAIEILDPAQDKWFIDLGAFAAYTDVTLTTEVTGDTLLPTIFEGGIALATQTPLIPEISPGSIVTVAGGNFAPPGTFVISPTLDADSRVSTMLANTCLEIGGFLSPMFAVTAGQANAQAHHALSLGLNDVFLIRDCGTVDEVRSPAGQVNVTEVSPGFFHFVNNLDGVNPIATLHGGGPGLVGEPGLLPGAEFTEAEPDEFVSFFATSFGAYQTPLEAGQIPGLVLPDTAGTTSTVHNVTLEIDGVVVPPEDLFYVGAAPCCAGLVQLVAKIHSNARDGRLSVKATVNGVSTPDGSYVSVKRRK